MKKFVTDTMALVLHLEKRKMPEKAKQCFEDTEKKLVRNSCADNGYCRNWIFTRKTYYF